MGLVLQKSAVADHCFHLGEGAGKCGVQEDLLECDAIHRLWSCIILFTLLSPLKGHLSPCTLHTTVLLFTIHYYHIYTTSWIPVIWPDSKNDTILQNHLALTSCLTLLGLGHTQTADILSFISPSSISAWHGGISVVSWVGIGLQWLSMWVRELLLLWGINDWAIAWAFLWVSPL